MEEKEMKKPRPVTEVPHEKSYIAKLKRMKIMDFTNTEYLKGLHDGKPPKVMRRLLWKNGFAHIFDAIKMPPEKMQRLRAHLRMRRRLHEYAWGTNPSLPLRDALAVHKAYAFYFKYKIERFQKEEKLTPEQVKEAKESERKLKSRINSLQTAIAFGGGKPYPVSRRIIEQIIADQNRFLLYHLGEVNFGVFSAGETYLNEFMRAHYRGDK